MLTTWCEYIVYRNCFWHSEQFLYTTCSAKRKASDKDLPILESNLRVLTYIIATVALLYRFWLDRHLKFSITCTFRPIPYVVPPLYCLCVLFMILYSAANTFRAWIAYEEKKISKPFRLFCQICYVNLAIAGLLFSLCFAVQPHDHESLIVHTGPFAYFTIALVMNQVRGRP